MKKVVVKLQLLFIFTLIFSFSQAKIGSASPSATGNDVIITGIFDGPLNGGIPKGIELVVLVDGTDLSEFGVGAANNGGGTDGEEFTMSGTYNRGDFIYIASESTGFTTFFGFAPTFVSGFMAINGDDAIELFFDGAVVDTFGDINVDGTGEVWEYLDGWAYRNDNTETPPARLVFDSTNYTYSGKNALDGETTNAGATVPFPTGTYQSTPTAIELSSFTAVAQADGSVSVEWVTASETDHAGYHIYHSGSEAGSFALVNNAIIAATGIQGQGASYSLLDQSTSVGTHWYRLEDVDIHGIRTSHGPISVEVRAPSAVGLANTSTTLFSGMPNVLLLTVIMLIISLAVFIKLAYSHQVNNK